MTLKNLSNILRKKLKSIKFDFFKNHFDLLVPSVLVKKFYETKNKKKSNELVEGIKNRWSDLKGEIKKMSED